MVEEGPGWAVEEGEVEVEGKVVGRGEGLEDSPGGVLDAVAGESAAAVGSEAPLVFFEVVGDGVVGFQDGVGVGAGGAAVGVARVGEGVFDGEQVGGVGDAGGHGGVVVGLVVEASGDEGDASSGDEFADEDDAALV